MDEWSRLLLQCSTYGTTIQINWKSAIATQKIKGKKKRKWSQQKQQQWKNKHCTNFKIKFLALIFSSMNAAHRWRSRAWPWIYTFIVFTVSFCTRHVNHLLCLTQIWWEMFNLYFAICILLATTATMITTTEA